MKLLTLIAISTILVLSIHLEDASAKPLSFNSFLEAVGLRRRSYVHGNYVPLNGQQMPQKPLSTSEEEGKIITSGFGAVGRECPEGSHRTPSGGCQTSYADGDW